MRVAIACMLGWAIGLSAGCSPPDSPLPSGRPIPTGAPELEAVGVQPNAEASPSADPVVQPAPEQDFERPTAAGPIMDENSGIAVGQKVPSFHLEDQNGEVRSLDEFVAQGNVALVFYRSADW